MIRDITADELDGLVIASCSPKLHMHTFRGMAERGGMNPYQYVHVNLREQCAWAHRNDREAATRKAVELVRAGIAKCRLSAPLHPQRLETAPKALVIGAGIAGMRAALALSDLGLSVHLVEKSKQTGGWVGRWDRLFPDDQSGGELAAGLLERVRARQNITLFTDAEVVEKTGTIGNFQVKVRVGGGDTVSLQAGAIIVATGVDTYSPAEGEYGWGTPGVVTLDEFKRLAEKGAGALTHNGKPVRSVAYIYCVGNRQKKSASCPKPNTYCGRYCCTAAVHTSACVQELHPDIRQYHLFRDMRTYGRNEMLYERARDRGAVFIRFAENAPPEVRREDGGLVVAVKDELTANTPLEIPADLVVLVTGMVPRENAALTELLKVPASKDGFFNEIHIKLRPVETVIDGVFIAGGCQSPKTMEESVSSALAAVGKAGALLLKGHVDLEPLVARVDAERCVWCGKCDEACPYGAIACVEENGKEVARVLTELCKGEGACVPVCPADAVTVEGYTDAQITAMIDAMAEEGA
jgi:heterodisulfide reductase subunit A